MRSSRSSVIQDCELLAEGEDLKVQSCPAPNRSSQGMQEGNEYGWHAGHVTLAAPKRSTIPVLTDFLAATILSCVPSGWHSTPPPPTDRTQCTYWTERTSCAILLVP